MIVTNKTEYLLRIRDITSQFAYVDLMWNTLKSMMVSSLASGDNNSNSNNKNIQPEQRLNVFLCAHSFNEWLRVLYMFYSTTVRYLREYEAGKATDIRSFLLVMLHRIDHSYRPEIARYMPVLQTVLASSFKSPSASSSVSATSTIHQKYNTGHATDIYDTIVMDADMLEIAFVEIRQLCQALYKDELKTDPTLEWQDVQVNLPVKSTHTRFESYTFV